MSMLPRLLVLAVALPAFALACSSAGPSADTAGGSDGDDSASADSIASGANRAKEFETPNLSPQDEANIVQGYAHLDPHHVIAPNLLRDAIVYFDVNKAHITNPGHMAIVDFKLNSAKERFYLVDMNSGAVTTHSVAHGSGSEDGKGNAVRFSNTDGTHESSLGFVLTGEIFSGKHGRSLRLDGLSSTNSAMRPRAIIIHSAAYVHDGPSRQGNSWGCFALDQSVKDDVVDALEGGALLYANLGDPNAPPLPAPNGSPSTAGSGETGSQPAPTGGASCSGDGDCNPGTEGSGQICANGECVPGCHTDAQCPGAKTCQSGQCQ